MLFNDLIQSDVLLQSQLNLLDSFLVAARAFVHAFGQVLELQIESFHKIIQLFVLLQNFADSCLLLLSACRFVHTFGQILELRIELFDQTAVLVQGQLNVFDSLLFFGCFCAFVDAFGQVLDPRPQSLYDLVELSVLLLQNQHTLAIQR